MTRLSCRLVEITSCGLMIHDNTLYVTKGSGGNGINTVYQVGTHGVLPTPGNAPGTPLNLINEPITIPQSHGPAQW